jgi:hypothetical protein
MTSAMDQGNYTLQTVLFIYLGMFYLMMVPIGQSIQYQDNMINEL